MRDRWSEVGLHWCSALWDLACPWRDPRDYGDGAPSAAPEERCRQAAGQSQVAVADACTTTHCRASRLARPDNRPSGEKAAFRWSRSLSPGLRPPQDANAPP